MLRRLMLAAALVPSLTLAEGEQKPVPPVLVGQIERDRDNAARSFSKVMALISIDSTISEMSIRRAEMAHMAASRANVLMQILSLDYDADGEITATEVDDYLQLGRRRSSSDVLLAVSAADTNNDKRVTYAEMRDYAKHDVESASSRSRNEIVVARALMVFDYDADGVVTLREMLDGVARYSPECSCVE